MNDENDEMKGDGRKNAFEDGDGKPGDQEDPPTLDSTAVDPGETVVGWPQAASIVGCSVSRLRRLYEGRHTERDENGRHVFPRAQLQALRETLHAGEPVEPPPAPMESAPAAGSPPHEPLAGRRPGQEADAAGVTAEIHALIIGDLQDGRTLPEIVRTRQFLPDVVEHVKKRWQELMAADLNTPSTPAELALQRQDHARLRQEFDEHKAQYARDVSGREWVHRWAQSIDERIGKLVSRDGKIEQPLRNTIIELVRAAVASLPSQIADRVAGLVSREDHSRDVHDLISVLMGMWPVVQRLAPTVGLVLPLTPNLPSPSQSGPPRNPGGGR